MTDVLVTVLSAVGTLFAAVVTTYLVPFLKTKAQEKKYQNAINVVQNIVYGAEQLFGNTSGEQKKDYVMGVVNGLKLGIPDELVEAFLEGAVNQLKSDQIIIGGVAVDESNVITEGENK